MMNVLLLGSGGREHAFAHKISRSKHLGQLYILPGNAGTARCGTNIEGSVNDFDFIKRILKEKNIHYLVVGPEEPLVNGIKDIIRKEPEFHNLCMVGPDTAGAKLEGSKAFAKKFMRKYNIPTARYLAVSKENLNEGLQFLNTLAAPFVLKADGLAAGKGVIILNNQKEAEEELKNFIFNNKLGKAGTVVVIEEFLKGIECSCFVFCDGHHYQILPLAKDYKRIGEGDTGPNTGGMGAVSPVPFAGPDFVSKVEKRIIIPTLEGMRSEGHPYEGFLFVGLMNVNGDPFVIEYNCRMGDPETEAVFPRLNIDFLEWFDAYHQKKLNSFSLQVDPRVACTVVMASSGYPGEYEKNKPITLPNDTPENIHHYYAGIRISGNCLFTSGGRVLALTALASNLSDARKSAYEALTAIQFEKAYYRKDIGMDL